MSEPDESLHLPPDGVTMNPNPKGPVGRLTGSLTNDAVRIRKLLTFANHGPTSNEATTARAIAYHLISDGMRRGVVDFGDFLDLIPGAFDYKDPDRH
jgi:hypothetical protein